MTRYPEKLAALVELLSSMQDEKERIDLLIDFADRFRPVPEIVARRPYDPLRRVEYCESEAYVWTELRGDGTMKFYFAVENPQGISAKALAAIFDAALSGRTPEEILAVPTDIVFDIFGRALSMGKNLGLTGILFMMQSQTRELIRRREHAIMNNEQ